MLTNRANRGTDGPENRSQWRCPSQEEMLKALPEGATQPWEHTSRHRTVRSTVVEMGDSVMHTLRFFTLKDSHSFTTRYCCKGRVQTVPAGSLGSGAPTPASVKSSLLSPGGKMGRPALQLSQWAPHAAPTSTSQILGLPPRTTSGHPLPRALSCSQGSKVPDVRLLIAS